jgi:polynucleotide 5'-kinase involved in rRNA processing
LSWLQSLKLTEFWGSLKFFLLEDRQEFTLALGIVDTWDLRTRTVWIRTPLPDAGCARAAAISLGDMMIDPADFSHFPLR